MSFKDMKSRSKKGFEKLNKELEKINTSNSSFKDDRIWKATQDKSGNGYAVIRFLPAPEGEDVPWVRRFNHGFKGPGGWCIENCPTTIDGSCPICEANSELWNSGTESNKNIARDRKRKLSYYANILVVSDSTHPENDGKVFLFRFGKKIFDKIQEAMNPEFEDENPVNPFDFWEGANFKLKYYGKWLDSPTMISPNLKVQVPCLVVMTQTWKLCGKQNTHFYRLLNPQSSRIMIH